VSQALPLRLWQLVFDRRASVPISVERLEPGPRDGDPTLVRFLAGALLCETKGCEFLERQASQTLDPHVRCVLERHAREVRASLGILSALMGAQARDSHRLMSATSWIFTRNRPLPEQTALIVVVQSTASAIYGLLGEQLETGRAAHALRCLAEERALHAEFAADLLAGLVRELPTQRRRALASLIRLATATLLVVHRLAHGRYMRRITHDPPAAIRSRVRGAIRRALQEVEVELRSAPRQA
jgi:hypothetical protein